MRILIIEDDPLLNRSLAATLRDERYAVDTAGDGEEGLSKAREGIYDAIVLDVMMPVLDGWQVLDRLRPGIKTPVLMLTARDTVPDRIKGLNKGADDYLIKPFDSEELIARINAVIRRTAGLPQPTVQVRDLHLDTALREVTFKNQPVALTPREYRLLEYLVLNRGKVVSRTLLYDHLFDENDDSLSNILDVHVSNLRKKLDAAIIKTRRGHGYIVE